MEQIYEGVPDDISEETLLIPRFDFLDPEEAMEGEKRKFVIAVNKQAKIGNTTINDIALKSYPFTYQLITLQEVEGMVAKGYKYFMDMVLMPKQMSHAQREAMIPSYIKYKSANKMFTNRYTQFRYYFYIRDLTTHDAYITTKLKGYPEVYPGMKGFLKRIGADASTD
ncbi:MAG: hypothetical protein AAF655_16360 [Bacteroidota bacterium]